MSRITAEQFETMYRPLHGRLIRYAGARVGADRAEDAVAHARLRAIRALDRYDHRHPKAFQAWIFLLVRSVCEGVQRHQRYVQSGERELTIEAEREALLRVDAIVVERYELAESLRRIAAVVDAVYMSDEQRRAMLGLLTGEPAQMTAEAMHVTQEMVRRKQAEAIAIVRRVMAEEA